MALRDLTPLQCFPGDYNCYINEFIQSWIIPSLLVIVLVVFAIFVLPKAGWKGVFLSGLIIFLILFWFGLVPGLPALMGYF